MRLEAALLEAELALAGTDASPSPAAAEAAVAPAGQVGSRVQQAQARRVLGEILARLESPEAEPMLLAALDEFQALDTVLDAARTQLALARLYGSRPAGRRLLQAASRTFRAVGAWDLVPAEQLAVGWRSAGRRAAHVARR